MHTLLLALAILCTVPLQPRVTQASEHLHTGVIPTVGIHEITEGALLFRTAEPGKFIPAPMLKTDVSIAVTGIIARATVRQEFTNPSHEKDEWAEGIDVFPLPETAAVDHLRMTVGERIIEGQIIKERGEGKKIYEQAKQEENAPVWSNRSGPTSLPPRSPTSVPANGSPVEIQYQQTIRY